MMWTASSSAPPGYSFWRLIDGRSSSLDAIEFRVTGLCLLATSMGTNTFQSVSSSAATSSNLGVFSVLEFLQVTDDFCWRHRQQKGHHCGFSIDETKDVEVGHGGGNRGYCQMDEWMNEWLCDWVRTERRMREKKGFGDNPLSPIGSWYHLMSWWGSVNWNTTLWKHCHMRCLVFSCPRYQLVSYKQPSNQHPRVRVPGKFRQWPPLSLFFCATLHSALNAYDWSNKYMVNVCFQDEVRNPHQCWSKSQNKNKW